MVCAGRPGEFTAADRTTVDRAALPRRIRPPVSSLGKASNRRAGRLSDQEDRSTSSYNYVVALDLRNATSDFAATDSLGGHSVRIAVYCNSHAMTAQAVG